MKKILPPSLIIFDWDNTLVDSWNIIHASMMATFDRLQMKRPWETIDVTKQHGRYSMRNSFPKTFGDDAMKARDIYYEEYFNRYEKEIKPLDGAGQVLADIAGKNITMAVISNKDHPLLLKEIAHLGWGDFFASVVGAGQASHDKPAPIPFFMTMEQIYGVEKNWPAKDNIWYVGDMNVDVVFARAVGMTSIMIPIEPLEREADKLLEDIGDLPKLLD